MLKKSAIFSVFIVASSFSAGALAESCGDEQSTFSCYLGKAAGFFDFADLPTQKKSAQLNELESASGDDGSVRREMRPVLGQVIVDDGEGAPKAIVVVEDPAEVQAQQQQEVKPTITQRKLKSPSLPLSTQQLLAQIPDGVGEEAIPKPRNVEIKRGAFDQEYIDAFEEFDAFEDELESIGEEELVEEKPTFEISVKTIKPKEHQIDTLGKALKALNTGQYETAATLYRMILKKDPKNQDAMLGLATAYHKAGKKSQARKAYQFILKKDPKNEAALNNILALASTEAPIHALREFLDLQRQNPEFSAIYAQKAVIYAKLDRTELAIKNLMQAIKLDPTNNTYRFNLAVLYDESGYASRALAIYKTLLQASLEGDKIPVSRNELSDRLQYLSGKRG